jgi:hypothetical protein
VGARGPRQRPTPPLTIASVVISGTTAAVTGELRLAYVQLPPGAPLQAVREHVVIHLVKHNGRWLIASL